MKPTHAMVLAAGLGTRMRPLTDTCPKPLLEVGGRALLDHALDRLEEAGVGSVVVNMHYRAEQVRAHLAGRRNPAILLSDESGELLDTGGGVLRALPFLGDAPFVVVNSDNIWLGEHAFAPLIDGWNPARMDALLLLVRKEDAIGYTRAGDFSLDNGRLARRGDASSAPFVFTGAQILSPTLFEGIEDGAFSLNRVWDEAISSGRARGVLHDGGWCDVGTPDGLRLAEEALARV